MKKVTWDLLGVLAIIYDLLMLPLAVFGVDESPLSFRCSLALTVFWSFDMTFSFFCGYHRVDGLMELRWRFVARRYLRSWFALDLMIVSMDWFFFAMSVYSEEILNAGRLNRMWRFFRAAKILRMVRLIRVLKLAALYEDICEFVLSERTVTMVNFARMFVALMVFVHYIACAWYALGLMLWESGSWLTDYIIDETEEWFLYMVSFHWTLAQFLPAPVREHPTNPGERCFALLVLLMGFVVFSSVIGSITAMITQSRQSAYKNFKESHLVRRFFADNNVTPDLANRISHFLRKKRRRDVVGEHDIPRLQTLPVSLQTDMHHQIYARYLANMVFFDLLDDVHRPAVVSVCHTAVSEVMADKGDVLFNCNSRGTHVRFIVGGGVMYYPQADESTIENSMATEAFGFVVSGNMVILSEAVLWTEWVHRGQALATDCFRCIAINVEHIGQMAFRLPTAKSFSCEFANIYMARLQQAVELNEEVDDVFVAFKSREDVQLAVIMINKMEAGADKRLSEVDAALHKGKHRSKSNLSISMT